MKELELARKEAQKVLDADKNRPAQYYATAWYDEQGGIHVTARTSEAGFLDYDMY